MMRSRHMVVLAFGVCLTLACVVRADEGMWLFNDPPRKLLKDRYNFEITDDWLDHLRQAAVRFNSGGSGSFVSARGLVMTNHHVAADALQKLSTPERDLMENGFYARQQSDELKCIDLELNVLESIEDVTKRVNDAVPEGTDPANAQKARRAVMNTIEQESLDKTGLRSDVVTLYQGGLYHLYRYKKYTDVRLVFAPEKDVAFFGGDPDNFEYPRYCLDIAFFRVYENDQPAQVKHFLRWSDGKLEEGELTFVAGHPGRTDRLNTIDHLRFLRDKSYPRMLNTLRRREVLLSTYSSHSLENARRAQDELFGIQNSRKARLGGLAGLQDPSVMQLKHQDEEQLKQAIAGKPELRESAEAWQEIGRALETADEFYLEYLLLESAQAFNSELFSIARTLVRLAEESQKPNADRLREYRESNLESLKQQLFSEAPIYPDLETIKLADSLGMFMELAGGEDPLLRKVLAGKSPRERAAELVSGTQLKDVAVRKRLAESAEALQMSHDPMIELARLVDGPARRFRKRYDEQVDEPMRQAYARISNARFAVFGTGVYPDATFTLRLAFGPVKGYRQQGAYVPAWTTFGGIYPHAEAHGNVPPFKLAERWIKNKQELDLDTPFNFVSTADIIGGNSGSPVVNRRGEVIGLIFDGNIYSLVLNFIYTDEQARAVSVHSEAIIHALRKLYAAGAVADELRKQ
jgi:hypothetical protein